MDSKLPTPTFTPLMKPKTGTSVKGKDKDKYLDNYYTTDFIKNFFKLDDKSLQENIN